MFSPSNDLFIFISTDRFLVKMTPHCLNPNLVLNLHAAVVLQSMITLVANSLSIKILLGCFFGSSTSSYLCFIWSERYFTVITCKIFGVIFLLHVFYSTRISINIYYCFYVISFIRFSAYINHIYIKYSSEVSGFFIFSFISLYSFNTFTETNSS